MLSTLSPHSAGATDAAPRVPFDQASDPDVLLFLHETSGKLQAKTFTPTGSIPYSNGYRFAVGCYRPATINGLHSLVQRMSAKSTVTLIRGGPTDACDPRNTRRIKADDLDKGDKAAFRECARSWVMLDYDKPALPGDPDLVHDPEGAVEAILSRCPDEMREASFVWQLGNSAGIKPKYSLHLFALLDRPVGGPGLERFCTENGFDPCVAEPIQPHYIAAPRFDGIADPVPRRFGIRRGMRERMDARPILIAGLEVEIEKRYEEIACQRRKALAELRPAREGEDATVADLLDGPFAGIVTREAKGGWVHCDCPNHKSSTRESLHVNVGPEMGKWRCTGCGRRGGTAWTLAMFLVGDDRSTGIAALKAAVAARRAGVVL